ncbi:hypothetical protein D6D54_05445 [Spiroplasma poulsonii]|uniref:Uncharacterized protein n=1 Tax=Spiroplasma poulsonii TaxID=2138 RepID=A0A3S0SE02_9MOLU|nr:hypothetical protein D6D54_05445 [Spiroplasma poulsonii]
MCHLPYVIDNKKKFLLETIELIKNNKEGIENQALEYNIILVVTWKVIYHTILSLLRGVARKYIVKKHLSIC